MLLATVIGLGIMAENLAGGNVAIALKGEIEKQDALIYILAQIIGASLALFICTWLLNENTGQKIDQKEENL